MKRIFAALALFLVFVLLALPLNGCGAQCKRGHSETHVSVSHDKHGTHISTYPVYVCDEYYPESK